MVESTNYETILAKLHAGAVVEVREIGNVWSNDPETQRIIGSMRLAVVLAYERAPGFREPPVTHCALVTAEQARTLIATGATWYGSAEANPRNG
jgi:hypothetical protein